MLKPIADLPIRRYDEFKVPLEDDHAVQKEAYDDPFLIASGLQTRVSIIPSKKILAKFF